MDSEMAFESGYLASPITVKKESPFFVLRGNLYILPGDPLLPIVVKLLPDEIRAVEAVCAWIARELGLPAPRPFFVRVRRSKLPSNRRWPFKEDEALCIGTEEISGGQVLKKFDSETIKPLLYKWPHLLTVAVFDHLIANDDRSDENLILDGRMHIWIIDHGRAFGGIVSMNMFDEPFPSFKNALLDMVASLPPAQRNQMRGDILTAVARTVEVVGRIPYSALEVDAPLASKIETLLQRRANALHAMVSSELGMPELFPTATSSTNKNLQ